MRPWIFSTNENTVYAVVRYHREPNALSNDGNPEHLVKKLHYYLRIDCELSFARSVPIELPHTPNIHIHSI